MISSVVYGRAMKHFLLSVLFEGHIALLKIILVSVVSVNKLNISYLPLPSPNLPFLYPTLFPNPPLQHIPFPIPTPTTYPIPYPTHITCPFHYPYNTSIFYPHTPNTPWAMDHIPAVVDFPTPPFPEATNTTCLTPAIGHFFGIPRDCLSFPCSSISTLL